MADTKNTGSKGGGKTAGTTATSQPNVGSKGGGKQNGSSGGSGSKS
jgi:hypothetical protein